MGCTTVKEIKTQQINIDNGPKTQIIHIKKEMDPREKKQKLLLAKQKIYEKKLRHNSNFNNSNQTIP